MDKENKIKIFRLISAFIIFAVLFILDKTAVFHIDKWYITLVIYMVPYFLAGYDVVLEAFANIVHGEIFDEAFLMMLASFGAFVIGEYEEAVAVMLFYQIGEFLSDLAVDKSRDSIEALMDISPEYANLYENGNIRRAEPGQIKISDVIVIKAGERIPLDGVVIEGTSFLDTSALTGESVTRKIEVGDEVMSGCLNCDGTFYLRVTKEYKDSTVARILEMVENTAERKSKTESFINSFARIYTPVVTILAVLIMIVPTLLYKSDWNIWLQRACTFLVISCPCALVISVPLSFFVGIGVASSGGILIKGGNYLEKLSRLKIVAFDKTGTITEGSFKVKNVIIHDQSYTSEKILQIASSLEEYSNHPIALSIKSEYTSVSDKSEKLNVNDVKEFAGIGITGNVDGCEVMLGGDKLLKQQGIDLLDGVSNNTVVHLLIDKRLIASVIIGDEIKSTSCRAIQLLKKQGIIKCVMLTGDRAGFAEDVALATGIDEVRSELLPGNKVEAVEELIEQLSGTDSYVAFAGDGINDAPSLMRADIGIAMGIGSDAAIEAADVVLADNNLIQIANAIRISKRTIRISRENIVFALFVKVLVLILGACGLVNMWMAVFADVGVSLIAILNALRINQKNLV